MIRWTWSNALYGVALTILPGLGIISSHGAALALAVGVLPAAALGVLPNRRTRSMVMAVGAIAGLSLFLGSLVASTPVAAVALIFALCLGVAQLAANPRHRLAQLALVLGLALFGAGLSISPPSSGAAGGALIIAGSVYAWLLSLMWPSRPGRARAAPAVRSRFTMFWYGLQIGLAGSIAAAIGFALGVDHPGWPVASALLVSRPDHPQLDRRAWQRTLAVFAGAVVACTAAAVPFANFAVPIVVTAAVVCAAATSGSRFYVMPFFATTVVLSLLLVDDTQDSSWWFLERLGLTMLGAGLALGSAWLVPRVAARFTRGEVVAGTVAD